jgi:ribosome biogenesis ATPase
MQTLWTLQKKNKINLNAPVSAAPDPPVEQPAQSTEPPAAPSTKRRTRRTDDASPVKRQKTSQDAISKEHTPPTARLSDLGGADGCIEKMLELVAMPICHPEIYIHTGVQPPRGVLLHGPPGCGKTLLANAMAGELGVPFISISAPSIVSGMSGESEKTLRDTFEEAKRVAPCLLFIDEIDAITPKRESASREMERRIVAQFLTCMDEMSWEKNDNKPVIVMGATNRPDSLDPALRRAGRFDHEIAMGVPDEEARTRILQVLCAKLRLEGDFDFKSLAKATPGYVGADLTALTGAAGVIAVKRIFKQLSEGTLILPSVYTPVQEMEIDVESVAPTTQADQVVTSTEPPLPHAVIATEPPLSIPPRLTFPLPEGSIGHFLNTHPSPLTAEQLSPISISFSDFTEALSQVQPSSKREGFTTIPDVTWADIGALHSTREELHMSIVQPIKRPEIFQQVGIEKPCGVLLWGPPGCGKTLLAKAVANESRANFISVKGPELLNKYVGESEKAVRQVFSRARASSPCVIFFDELDALVPRRDDSMSESSARVVNTLLTELDGLDSRKSVYVIAATNRPDMIDPAMVRPGRLDKLLYVDLPSAHERAEIVKTITRRIPIAPQVALSDLEALFKTRCDGYSGADLAAVVREAGVVALKRTLGKLEELGDEDQCGTTTSVLILLSDFNEAVEKVGPSVSIAQRRRYEALRNKFAGLPMSYRVRENDKADEDIPSSS